MKDGFEAMERLREEYEKIPVPAALQHRLGALVCRSSRRKRYARYGKRLAGGVAAAAVALTAAANCSPRVSAYLADIPVIGAFTQLVTFRNFQEQRGNMQAAIETPHVVGLQDRALQEALNEQFDQYGDQLIRQYRADTARLGEASEGVSSGYSVMMEDERLLCVNIHTVLSAGSAQQLERYYVVDKQAGEILSLDDLFQDGADYVGVLSRLIRAQMEEQARADDSKVYDENFERIAPAQPFYLNKQHELVVSFDEYEVAPGYMGAVAFTIPTDEIRDLLRDDSPVGLPEG